MIKYRLMSTLQYLMAGVCTGQAIQAYGYTNLYADMANSLPIAIVLTVIIVVLIVNSFFFQYADHEVNK